MDANEKIRNFIYEKRTALGLTQEEFAELTLGKKQRSRINNIEKGRPIGFKTLSTILTNLNCDIEIIER